MRRASRLAAALVALAVASGEAAARCEDWVPQPKPQNASRDIVGQDLDQIVERGWMLFAVYDDNAPYSWTEDGEMRGVDVEIARLIAEDLGVEARFRGFGAGENADADLREQVWRGPVLGGGVANVMMRAPFDLDWACRQELVVLGAPYHQESLAIAYSEAVYPDDAPTPAYFRFDKVGVENDSLSDFYLSNEFGGALAANVVRFPSTAAAMAALEAGDVAAAMGPRAQLEYGMAEGLALHEPPLPGLAKERWTLGTAVRHNWRPLAYALEDAVQAAVEDGRIGEIFARHGLSYRPPAW